LDYHSIVARARITSPTGMHGRASTRRSRGLGPPLAVAWLAAAGDVIAADGNGNQATDLPSRTVKELEQDRRAAPKKEPEEKKKPEEKEESGGRLFVPLVIYTPETHVALGGLVIQFFRIGDAPADSRVSSVAIDALVTTRRQAIFEIMPDLYWDEESNHVFGKIDFQRFPDNFWGIGPDTPDSAEEQYDRDRLRLKAGAQRRVFRQLYAGVYSEFWLLDATYPDQTKTFATQNVPGEEGGFSAGLGPMVSFDSRDNTVSSRSGTLLSVTWTGYGPFVGSKYEFWKLQTEARQFFPVGEESALALRYYGEFNGGFVPYYHLAMIGGDELLRGYYQGRYRDKEMLVLETEYRFPLFWRFGAVVFAGAGEVADEFLGLGSQTIHWAVGGGFRLNVNTKERLNLRLDFGIGPGTFGVYFTAREAF
jgi:hypothetical protein